MNSFGAKWCDGKQSKFCQFSFYFQLTWTNKRCWHTSERKKCSIERDEGDTMKDDGHHGKGNEWVCQDKVSPILHPNKKIKINEKKVNGEIWNF
jgi:hypothetical protein